MKRTTAALVLLGIQLALVLSIAGKYLYERKTRPRIWVRTAPYDPGTPLRGRYLALQPVVDACALPRDEGHFERYDLAPGSSHPGAWRWDVTFVAEDGHLTPRFQPGRLPEGTSTIRLASNAPCERARVNEPLLYFIPDSLPDHAPTLFPPPAGHELWVEVTVPAAGPPRPIQLALSGSDGFKPLELR